MGPRERETYNTHVFDNDTKKMNFISVLQQFDDDYSPQKNEAQSRSSVTNVNLQNSLIRDMVKISIKDNHLSQRLLLETNLTLYSTTKLEHTYFRTSMRSTQNPELANLIKTLQIPKPKSKS